jgi:hypothetical protein
VRSADPVAQAALERVERVLAHMVGSAWHHWDKRQRLVIIWRAERDNNDRPAATMEAVLRVVNLDDGDEVGVWPIHPSPEASATGAVTPEDAVAAAMARIDRGFI